MECIMNINRDCQNVLCQSTARAEFESNKNLVNALLHREPGVTSTVTLRFKMGKTEMGRVGGGESDRFSGHF